MWNMTPFGILMPSLRPPKYVPVGDDRNLQIRARRAKDLDILRAKYMPGSLGETIHTPDKDYEFRAYCTHEAYAVAMMRMVMDIDYIKFKPETDKYSDTELHNCYNSIWGVVLRGLSSTKHQWDYWKANPSSRTKGGGKPATGTGWSGGGWDDDRITAETSMFGAHWPRDTSASRDVYDPEVWDEHYVSSGQYVSTGDVAIDALYAEIDAVLDAQKNAPPIDHAKCEHADTANARSKCRRRHRRAVQARIAEIRELIDESYADAVSTSTVLDPTVETIELPEADVVVTAPKPVAGGYPWERKALPAVVEESETVPTS